MEFFLAVVFLGVILWVTAQQSLPNSAPQQFIGHIRGRFK